MPWWLVWVLLVLAALAFLIWIGLRLYRQVKALLAELRRAEAVVIELQEKIADLEEAAATAGAIEADLTLTPERRAELHETRAAVRATRQARRRARYERASASWDEVTGPQ